MEVSEQDRLTYRLLGFLMRNKETAIHVCTNKEFQDLLVYLAKTKHKNFTEFSEAYKQAWKD